MEPTKIYYMKFLNQARTWYLKIDLVPIFSMRACVCVCVYTRGY